MYLAYIRYSAYLFCVLSFFSIVVLLPMFVEANKDPESDLSSLQKMTIINATDKYAEMWVAFVFTVCYSIGAHVMMYFYERKRRKLKMKTLSEDQEISESDISQHTILIRGINRKLPLEVAQKEVKLFFES